MCDAWARLSAYSRYASRARLCAQGRCPLRAYDARFSSCAQTFSFLHKPDVSVIQPSVIQPQPIQQSVASCGLSEKEMNDFLNNLKFSFDNAKYDEIRIKLATQRMSVAQLRTALGFIRIDYGKKAIKLAAEA